MNFIYFITLIFCCANLPTIHAQDTDQDGLSDPLETALARRFAPEWRFHGEVPGDGSSQNRDELYYPVSMEFFHKKVVEAQGKPPELTYGGKTSPIAAFQQLDNMTVPGTSKRASDASWGNCTETITLEFPEKLPGDPKAFTTYYRCYKAGGDRIGIAYLLFYPFDYKGKFLGIFEFGNHRGDWEGINVLVSGISDFNNPAAAANGVVEQVKYSGHGPKRYLKRGDAEWCAVDGTHPKIYLSWGSHTPYPEPGEWHNYKIDFPLGIANLYDDFFHGTGSVAQSWAAPYALVNLGETAYPLVGWLNFAGRWGPDDNGGNSSPSGPLCKSVWTHEVDGWTTWAEAKLPVNYEPYWEESFEPSGTKCLTVSTDNATIPQIIEVSPNPMRHSLFITTQQENGAVLEARFYNAVGQLVLVSDLEGQHTSIEVSPLPEGFYWLQISSKQNVIATIKLFKTA